VRSPAQAAIGGAAVPETGRFLVIGG